jgi:hypothetical protein
VPSDTSCRQTLAQEGAKHEGHNNSSGLWGNSRFKLLLKGTLKRRKDFSYMQSVDGLSSSTPS